MSEMIEVKSSNIKKVGYGNGNLFVEFMTGNVYLYAGVPQELFEELLTAESVGKFVNSRIKPNYPATKVLNENIKK